MVLRKLFLRIAAILIAAVGTTLVVVSDELRNTVCEKLQLDCAVENPTTGKTP